MASKASKKVRSPEQQVIRLARRLLPAAQVRPGEFRLHDVQNRTEDDQRHMLRSEEKKTVRRVTHIEKLYSRGVLDRDQTDACEWYANAYTLGYDTIGITADYERSGGGTNSSFCLLSRYRAQREAREDYDFARQGIAPWLLPIFERVILERMTIAQSGGRNAAPVVKLAAWQLHGRISHLLPVR